MVVARSHRPLELDPLEALDIEPDPPRQATIPARAGKPERLLHSLI